MMKTNFASQTWRRAITVALAATLIILTTIIVVLSQGQDEKDLKGKTKQVVVVPNGTVNAGEIVIREDPNHQGDPTPSPTPTPSPDASPTPSPGGTPTPPPTGTPTPTPTPTPGTYEVTRSEGAIVVPGDTDIGNHADDGTTTIPLPFAYTLYDRTFTEASVSSNGVLQFDGPLGDSENTCLPYPYFSYAVLPFWDNLRTDPEGVFTSVSGSEPNRIFNIEWRAEFAFGGEAHFEVRLYEGQTRLDVIYGNVVGSGATATVGVQKDISGDFTEFECNGSSQINSGTQLTFTLLPGAFPTPTPLVITPNPVNITINSVLGQRPVPLRVTRANGDGSVSDLTTDPGTTYQSSNTNAAIVDDFGVVAGVQPGPSSITARNGNSTGTVPVVVSSFNPMPLSSISIPGYANSVRLRGDYAFVAAGDAGLQILDVSDRTAPFIAGALDTNGNANDVKVVANTAYVADGPAGLQIIDITHPASPVLLGTVDTPGDAQSVAIAGNRAYVADGDSFGLQIIDISNLSAPAILGSLPLEGVARCVEVSNNFVLVGLDFVSLLDVVDVSNPANPQVVGSVLTRALRLRTQDSFAYVATGSSIDIVDFSIPANPRIVSQAFDSLATDVELFDAYALSPNTNRVLNPVSVFDANDPSRLIYEDVINSTEAGRFFFGTAIALDSQYAYWTGTVADDYSFYAGGQTGNSRLFIAHYQAPASSPTDTGGIPPVVSIDTPQNGQTVFEGGPITISAPATDDVRVAGVRFSVNGVVVVTDFAAPYQFSYIVPLNASSLVISATAFDLAGNETTSTPVMVSVSPDPPPTVTITSPAEGATIFEGQTIELSADATDNVQVSQVTFTVNGEDQGTFFNAPYTTFYTVPDGISSLSIVATATDNLGRISSAARSESVILQPRTTVTGRVLESPGQPAEGLTATVFSQFTSQTDADGTFTITGVPTVRGNISVFISGQLNGRSISLTTSSKAPVPDSTTDFGDIILTNVSATPLGEAPSALGSANFIGNSSEDVFAAFQSQSSQIYQADPNLNLVPSSVTLPFTSVLSGAVLRSASMNAVNDRSIIAQTAGQPGIVTLVQFHAGTMQTPIQIATGLSGDSEFMAAGNDGAGAGGHRPVIAFLKVTGGTMLTARFGDSQGGFGAPIELPVDPAAALRSPSLADVDGDGLVDLLLISQGSGTDGHLIVYPRVSATAFGSPIESPVVLRSTIPTRTTVDFSVGNLLTDDCCTPRTEVAVLGDDRVRIYRGSAGVFTFASEIMLPADSVPLGILAASQVTDSFYDSLIVNSASTLSAQSKSIIVYTPGRDDGSVPPQTYRYSAAPSADTRIVSGYFNDPSFVLRLDLMIIDGGTAITFWDIGLRRVID
jgi:hypothetical protein